MISVKILLTILATSMNRMAGDAFKGGSSFGNDKDLIELDDEGTKVPKDEVAEYIENNYKKNKVKSFNGF